MWWISPQFSARVFRVLRSFAMKLAARSATDLKLRLALLMALALPSVMAGALLFKLVGAMSLGVTAMQATGPAWGQCCRRKSEVPRAHASEPSQLPVPRFQLLLHPAAKSWR